MRRRHGMKKIRKYNTHTEIPTRKVKCAFNDLQKVVVVFFRDVRGALTQCEWSRAIEPGPNDHHDIILFRLCARANVGNILTHTHLRGLGVGLSVVSASLCTNIIMVVCNNMVYLCIQYTHWQMSNTAAICQLLAVLRIAATNTVDCGGTRRRHDVTYGEGRDDVVVCNAKEKILWYATRNKITVVLSRICATSVNESGGWTTETGM